MARPEGDWPTLTVPMLEPAASSTATVSPYQSATNTRPSRGLTAMPSGPAPAGTSATADKRLSLRSRMLTLWPSGLVT